MTSTRPLAPAVPEAESFVQRHIGPSPAEQQAMLRALGYESLDAFVDAAVPETIRLRRPLALGPARTEHDVLAELRAIAGRNQVWRSYLGMGYHGTLVPPVVQRNVLENPGWYTAYTPYQAEIAQGRLEALLNFQTVVATSRRCRSPTRRCSTRAPRPPRRWPCATRPRGSRARRPSSSPPTATRRRSRWCARAPRRAASRSSSATRPRTRSAPTCSARSCSTRPPTAAWPTTARSPTRARRRGARRRACDLLALALLVPPGEWGADVAVGNSQRFGVPMGYGGPHAAFFATRDEFKRSLPGRIIGVSRDADGRPALRMALQTREQHIRREKATSNVCTAQVLLAVMAGHVRGVARPRGGAPHRERVHGRAAALKAGLERLGFHVRHEEYFDTVAVDVGAHGQEDVLAAAAERRINLRTLEPGVLACASTRRSTRPTCSTCSPASTAGRRWTPRWPSWPRRPTRATTSGSRARARTSRTRCSTRTTARRRCCATCAASRRRTSRSCTR
jgi:glycine dehydrogenase